MNPFIESKIIALIFGLQFILSLSPETVSPKYSSGGSLLKRPVSSAQQDFQTDKSLWPVNKPVPKLEAFLQCSGR